MKIINLLFPIIYWLKLIQSQNYSSKEFLKTALKTYFKREEREKEKLIWTPKIILIFIITSFLILINLIFNFYFYYLIDNNSLTNQLFQLFVNLQFSFLYIWGANILISPLKDFNKIFSKNKINQKLQKQLKLTTIIISGNKNNLQTNTILTQILSSKFQVLSSSQNLNTLDQVNHFISHKLQKNHEILIISTSFQKTSQVSEIINLTNPKIIIFTDTDEMPKKLDLRNKTLFFNFDNQVLKENLNTSQFPNTKLISYSLNQKADWQIKNLEIKTKDKIQTSFILQNRNQKINLKTEIINPEDLQNIIVTLATCHKLKLPTTNFPNLISKLKPFPHRMQIIPNDNEITIIDNSDNPDFQNTSQTLSLLKNKRKILVTSNFNDNFEKICDILILFTKNRKQIKKIENKENIILVKSLKEAQEKIQEITQAGDIIIFEK